MDLEAKALELANAWCGHLSEDACSADFLAVLHEVERETEKRVAERCAEIVENAYPCSCDKAYTDRKLTAPDCFKCNALDEAACQIRDEFGGKP